MPFFGVPIRNGLPLGLGSVVGLAKQSAAPSPPPPSSDPYFEYVTLLLNTTSTNGAQNNTFLDSSTNNFTVTRNGDTTQGSFNPYMPTGYWSGYFDGTGDYLSVVDNAALQMASGNFTIEFWIKFASITGFQTIYEKGYTAAGGLLIQTGNGDGTLIVYASGVAQITASSASSVGAWDHYALVRSGTTLTLYKNGTSVGSTTNSTNFNSTASLFVGGSTGGGGYYTNGYLSNVRVVKGTAVYTAAFTPPTTPLTAITNTSLLCLQDNRFKDNSTNAFTITRNGDTRISKFAPFNPPASWDAATYGGSGYFDGVGDYLSVANGANLQLGSNNFTIEFFIYFTDLTGTKQIINTASSGGATNTSYAILHSGTSILYYLSTTGSTWDIASGVSVGTATVGQWFHVALVRNGSTFTPYLNGVAGTTSTSSSALFNFTSSLGVGSNLSSPATPITGFISNLRIVNGTAVYTAAFTPPTAPLTAITNTSLLLNFTNAGIYDAATINDVRTVGNLQVSTTQAKFGTTSMYFDGTGDYGDVLSVPENAARTGAFTLETWAYLATADAGVERYIFFQYGPGVVLGVTSGNYVFGATYLTILASTNTIPLDQWVHIALVREGTGTNQFKLYVNGVLADTGTSTRDLTQSPIRIGATNTATSPWKGYLDEMRMTNGYARYTGNFTPPTAAFPTL